MFFFFLSLSFFYYLLLVLHEPCACHLTGPLGGDVELELVESLSALLRVTLAWEKQPFAFFLVLVLMWLLQGKTSGLCFTSMTSTVFEARAGEVEVLDNAGEVLNAVAVKSHSPDLVPKT